MNDIVYGVRLEGNSKSLVAETRSAREEFAALQKQAEAVNVSSGKMASQYSGLNQSFKQHNTEVKETAANVNKLLDRYDPLGARLRQLQADFKALNTAAMSGKIAAGDDARVDQVYANLQKQISGFSDASQKATISAGQLRMATQQLPLQFQDIWVSLAAGQNPMMVLAQQGSQISGSFGGVGNAAKAMGGYIMGLINPVTLTAAAVAAGAAAWYYWGESAKEAAAKAKAAAQEAEKDAKAAWSGVQLSTDEQIAILEGKIAGARGELDAALARRAAITRSTSAEEAQAIGAQVVERRKELEGLQRQIDQLQADDSKKRKSAAEKAERDYARALVETNRILDDIDPLHKANTEWQKLLDLQIKSKGAFTDEQMGQAYAKAMSGIEKQTEKTAAAMSKTWETFADNTQRTLSDVLYNGMNGKFNDIEDLFKQMLFRMAANAASARLTESLFGNSKDSGDKGLIGSVIKWLANANGNAFGNSGVYAFANGGTFSNGLYDRPTPFKFANGGGFSLGVMGEAGPEAVMPLARGSDGKLGVRAQGGGGQVIEYHDHTTNHYHIDSRSDRAQLMSDMSRLVDQKQAQFRERMKRGTV